MPENASHPGHVVTAVIVAHDAARLLPGLVKAVREQTYPVHRAVGVDTGSRDRSGTALAELLGSDAVFGTDPDTGYGAAVSRALQHPAARRPASGPGPAGDRHVEWIWLLHDDCEPASDALEQMLRAASRGRTAAVLGPKLRDLADRRVLREAGVTADRAGRRLTGVEPGEIDQGQHDGNRPVLAVSSAGMLIRRDVWDQMGGFDPNLPLFRDDIDFCWRVHAAGYDVRVITDAVVYHRELSARQIRTVSAAGGRPRLLERRGALYVFAVNLPLGPMVAIVGGCVAGSLLRAAYFLITKQQRRAADHLGAVAWLARHPVVLWRARRRRAAGRKQGWAVARGQLPRGRPLARLAESAAALLSRGPGYESGGLHQAVIDEADDDIPPPVADSAVRRVLTSPGVLLCAALALTALVAERSLVGSVLTGSGTLGGGALVPAWGGASDLWREYLAGYHDAGLGSAASAPPYLAVVAALATLLAGKTWLAVDVLLLGCVPAAGVTAFLAARRITPVPAVRVWVAVTYALLPVAMGAVAAGRLGTAVAFVLLPVIGIAVDQMCLGPPRAARRAAWAAGLLVAVAAAFVPLVWPVAVAAALGAAAARPWLVRRTVLNAAIVAAVPAVVLMPWTFHLVASPSSVLLEAGLQPPGLASAGLRAEPVLLLSPGGPGLPPAWVTAGLVLSAFCALLARRRAALVYTGWGIALTGLTIALVVSRVRVAPPQGGPAVSSWPGIAVAMAAIGLLLAATPLVELAVGAVRRTGDPAASPLPADDGRRDDGSRDGGPHGGGPYGGGPHGDGPYGDGPYGDRSHGERSRTDSRALAGLAALTVAASAPLLAAGYWLAAGVRGPATAAGSQILPAFVAASSSGPDRTRTLVLRQDGGVLSYTVLRTSDPLLGEPELTAAPSATDALDGVVASLDAAGSGDGGDTGQALGQFDIGFVLLPAPVDQSLVRQLDGAAGLVPLTKAPAYDLWQVTGNVARMRVISADGAVVPVPSGPVNAQAVIPAGASGTLVLAEAAGGWSATLNGWPLAALAEPVDGWAQGFVLPAGGGRLVITRDETARDLSLGFEAAAVVVVFALALPGTRSAVPLEAAEAEAGSGPDAAAPPGGRRDQGRRQARPERGRKLAAPARTDLPGRYPGTGGPSLGPDTGASPAPRPRKAGARGGQHTARHGKPSRRSRRSPAAPPAAGQPVAGPSDVGQPPVTIGPDRGSFPADGYGEAFSPATHDPAAAGPRLPWELGDRP